MTDARYTLEEVMAAPRADVHYGPKCPHCESRNTKRAEVIEGRYCIDCHRVFDLAQVIQKAWAK